MIATFIPVSRLAAGGGPCGYLLVLAPQETCACAQAATCRCGIEIDQFFRPAGGVCRPDCVWHSCFFRDDFCLFLTNFSFGFAKELDAGQNRQK